MKTLIPIIALLVSLLHSPTIFAWDSVGHRVTAAVAYDYLSPATREQLITILRAHPRFDQDFQSQIPAYIDRNDRASLQRWLLGQAAFWPDMARGLPDAEEALYNRPPWHYIDGAWLRDSALLQGNIYIDIAPFADIDGRTASAINRESDAGNVVTALDWNSRVLASPVFSEAERALALCWVLHLIGDIHQPMHTGSAYSARLFPDGDLGGNSIPTDDGNLHARWDGAVRESGVAANTEEILQLLNESIRPRIEGVASDWTQWMDESRRLLPSAVYDSKILAAIRQAEQSNTGIIPISLNPAYVEQMQRLSRQRLGLAGLRLAIWFENQLN